MHILSIRDLQFAVQGQMILKNITLDVSEGEIVGIIGPNGSGKTTLFNVLSGFHKPGRGTLHFRGIDITSLSAPERSRIGIGRVFQNFGIFREMTLRENVLVALESLSGAERKALEPLNDAVNATLAMVGLLGKADQKAHSLSGGQMRLLEIARTLASKKQLFLLDEPTAGVSPKMTQEVALLIRRLKQEGKTVVIVEHDLPFIRTICDRVVVLDVGEIVLQGSPEQVHANPKLRELYFGADPTE